MHTGILTGDKAAAVHEAVEVRGEWVVHLPAHSRDPNPVTPISTSAWAVRSP